MSLLAITQILSGLGAGFLLAWSVTVIPGTKKSSDSTYLEVMQRVNKEIFNPLFFVIFFGPQLFLIISAVNLKETSVIAAAAIYALGVIGLTMAKNVPLNNNLEAKDLSQMSDSEKAGFRTLYESPWNRWHYIRTAFSVLAFVLVVCG